MDLLKSNFSDKLEKTNQNFNKFVDSTQITLPWDYNVFEEDSEVVKRMGRYSKFSPRNKVRISDKIGSELSLANSSKRKKLVLVTDDSYCNRMVLIEMLKRFNIFAMEAIDGEDAINAVKKSFSRDSNFEIKLILMDLNMPIVNGIESTIRIREIEKSCKKDWEIPIVAVTAHNTTADKISCLKVGMQAYMLKPVSSKSLKEIIEKYAKSLMENASTYFQ